MAKPPYYFIANWKMYHTYWQAIRWLDDHTQQLHDLIVKSEHIESILCPSFTVLEKANFIMKPTAIKLGAQNCSSYDHGAYTGEVSARSLQEVGCTYCIVGHSERRRLFNETTQQIAQKAYQLLTHGIIPIICIGESADEKNAGIEYIVDQLIEKQLKPIIDIIEPILKENRQSQLKTQIFIAYEPAWAIGSGKLPEIDTISKIFGEIVRFTQTIYSHNVEFKLLYGGSVSGQNSEQLKKVEHLNGLLIGKSSLDFQELKKIVSWFI